VAERICNAVAALAMPHPAAGQFVSVSVGVAAVQPAPDATESALIAMSDSALYCAKRDGRNRAVLHEAAHSASSARLELPAIAEHRSHNGAGENLSPQATV
jgi:predicted signal transduction protein with EAL and GGDEF domain